MQYQIKIFKYMQFVNDISTFKTQINEDQHWHYKVGLYYMYPLLITRPLHSVINHDGQYQFFSSKFMSLPVILSLSIFITWWLCVVDKINHQSLNTQQYTNISVMWLKRGSGTTNKFYCGYTFNPFLVSFQWFFTNLQ